MEEYRNLCDDSIGGDLYDSHKIPPDIDMARKHGMANGFGTAVQGSTERCPCGCYRRIERSEINPFMGGSAHDTDELAIYGSGYPLYVNMVFFTIILLLFPFCISSGFFMWQNYNGDVCIDKKR